MPPEKPIRRHIVGCTRTIRTAVLVVEYLRRRNISQAIPGDAYGFIFKDPTPENGWWSADIIVTLYGDLDLETSSRLVDLCRAFVAGSGEIWT